jgi:Zn-dependent peptidase ImmA (M78 family)
LNVKINPELLKWARREAGFTIQEIADQVGVEPERFANWEVTGADMPWGKLKEVSKRFKRQLAVFFLPEAPPETKKPSDFRNARLSTSDLSKETLLAIRRARKYLKISASVMGEGYWLSRYNWLKDLRTTSQFRSALGITLSDQESFKYPSEAFKAWRNSLETNLGISVFQFSLPLDEIQAFCISDSVPFGIVLNSKHSYNGRIFSLFHELAHISKSQSGMCFPEQLDKNQSEELVCNKFAGKFLVPDSSVPHANTLSKLTYYANRLKVSREVILRRSLDRSYVTKAEFFDLLEEIRQLPLPRGRGGPLTPVERAQSSRGLLFFNLVLGAAQSNRIDFNTASDALGLKLNYLMYA